MDGLFWEVSQQHKIRTAGIDASLARSKAESVREEVRLLSRKVERLALASQALWELLRDHTELEEAHIIEKMQEIDLRDGAADGRISATQIVCPSCSRKAHSGRTACLYCGVVFDKKHIFE